jgi:hypothetical protein
MADNLNQKSIYVETDYDNIILIDPNKIVVNDVVKDRLVEHEELVFYANLSTRSVPRTKLAVGIDGTESNVVNTTIATLNGSADINFLQPKGKRAFDTSWSNQLTGAGSRDGLGANQTKETEIQNKDGTTRYVRDILNYEDTQMLGITSIKVDISGGKAGGMFVPTVDIELVDVQGRTLFEQGEKSLYSVFFNLPYPIFYLTLKGYYGKAIRYSLNLISFNATFDQELGNFKISLKLLGKNSGLLSDSLLDYARTAPKMSPTLITEEAPSPTNSTTTTTNSKETSLGSQILDEVYGIYKSKGLVASDFPHLTIDQFIEDADSFTTTMQQNIEKGDFVILSDIDQFRTDLKELKDRSYKVILKNYLDTTNYFIYNDQIYYPFKNTLTYQKRVDIINAIKKEINNSLDNMRKNASFGQDADGNDQIPVNINDTEIFEQFNYTVLTFEDYKKTLSARIKTTPTDDQVNVFITQLTKDFILKETIKDVNGNDIETFPILLKYGEILFGGVQYVANSFLDKIQLLFAKIDEKEEKIETQLSEDLSKKLIDKNGGLGYAPTIRNVMAILMAGLDTFYRLMDRTHTQSWNQRDNPRRVSTILPPNKNEGIDGKNNIGGTSTDIKNINIVYPWPTYYVQETEKDGTEKYNIRYVGDPKYSDKTEAFDLSVWPEVKFLEDYLNASTKKNKEINRNVYNNPKELAKYGSCNTIYFPFDNVPYENTSIVPFFYEMYERIYALSHYTKLNKSTFNQNQIGKFLADLEAKNIIGSAINSPELKQILKTKKYNLQTLRDELRSISNNGTGGNWSDFIRDNYVTEYIKNDIQNDFGLYDLRSINARSISLDNTIPLVDKFQAYLRSSNISELSFLDTLPYTDSDFIINYSPFIDNISFNDTSKTYIFLDDKKTIARINETDDYKTIRCFKYYADQQFKNFNTKVLVNKIDNTTINDRTTLQNFFKNGTSNSNYITVDKIKLNSSLYKGNVGTPIQQCSLLNTPYFVNALLKGVEKDKLNEENPYAALGYIYLNSIPLADLVDQLYDINKDENLDALGATLKNFSSIHQIPYSLMLKYGSIWHRYKKYIDDGVDILDGVWNDFNYKKYYATNESLSTNYKIRNYTGGTIDFYGFKSDPFNSGSMDLINTGFYPKLINDFYWYFTKKDLFTGYTQTEFDDLYTQNKLKIGLNTSASYYMGLGGDPNNLTRSIRVNPFFQYLTFDKDPLIDKNYKTHLLIPSNGGININQTVLECFNNTNITIEVKDNPAVYNGSVRSLWGASQYGYFDNTQITKPAYNQYVNFSNKTFLPPSIEDIFAVFKPELLDQFEKAFLGFSKREPTQADILILDKEQTSPSYTSTNKITNVKQRRLFDQIKNIFLVKNNDVNLINQQNQDAYELANAQISNFTLSVKEFMSYDFILKIGNAGNFDRKIFNSFLNELGYTPTDPITFTPYILNTLPGAGQSIDLITSRATYPNEWKILQKYVGFSTIKDVFYANTGSTITDFFIDMNVEFTESNIKSLYQIIKIFARYKQESIKKNIPFSSAIFKILLKTFISDLNLIDDNMVTEISTYLNKNLPVLKVKNTATISTVEGDVTKLSIYNVFQTLNDKWVAGSDLTTKTLFEDFLFHDVANNDIGDKIQVDLERVRDLFKSDGSVDILAVVGELLRICGDMIFYSLPAYVNFYGIQEPSKKPQAVDIDPANTLFGTWTNVDYLASTAKFLCIYTGKESDKLQQRDNSFVLYGDDSYDFRNPASNPLRVQDNKQNKSISNKVVGFNVDFGIRNQNMFKGFTVGMDDKKNTSVTFQVNTDLGNVASGDKISQQTTSLYSFYKSLSYNCTITSLANVMIQPMMYFNLRHVPLFYGPYYIYNVTHTVNAQGFETQFKGSRMPKYALPQPDSLATYVKTNYLEKYKAKILERKNTEGAPTNLETILDPEGQKKENSGKQSDQEVCEKNVNNAFKNLPYVNVEKYTLTYEDLKILLNNNVTERDIKLSLFTIALTRGINASNDVGTIEPLNKNYFELNAINLRQGVRPEFKELICVESDGFPTPLFSFTGETDSIKVASSFIVGMVPIITVLKTENGGSEEDAIAQFIIATWDNGAGFTLDAKGIKAFVIDNITNNEVAQATYDSYVATVKIAQSYFP